MTQRHFVHQKFYAMCPGIEAGLSPWEMSNYCNHLRYTTVVHIYICNNIYCGVFTPCRNCNIETRSRDYATVGEVVFSPCRAKRCRIVPSRASPHPATSRIASPRLLLSDSCKHLDDAKVGRDHVTSACSVVTQQ
jgi:hypothetical protein